MTRRGARPQAGWAGPRSHPAATLCEQVQLPDGQTALSALVELCSQGTQPI